MPSWFGFLQTEADLALTFIAMARDHLNPERSAGLLRNARTALSQIQRGLANPAFHGLSENEIAFLEQRCTEVESALRDENVVRGGQ